MKLTSKASIWSIFTGVLLVTLALLCANWATWRFHGYSNGSVTVLAASPESAARATPTYSTALTQPGGSASSPVRLRILTTTLCP